MYRPVCELDDEHRTAVFDFDSNPRKRQKMRPPNGDLVFWCCKRGFEPRDRGDAAITFIRFAQKRFAFWCPWFERAKPRKENRPRKAVCFSFGAPAGIRTPDTLLKRQVLCLLSYWGIFVLPNAKPNGEGSRWKRVHQIKAQRSGFDLEKENDGIGQCGHACMTT